LGGEARGEGEGEPKQGEGAGGICFHGKRRGGEGRNGRRGNMG
jgi:hypothetical protein